MNIKVSFAKNDMTNFDYALTLKKKSLDPSLSLQTNSENAIPYVNFEKKNY